MSNLDLNQIKSAHFIGIGGIGISAIARMLLQQGCRVSGSDRTESVITKELAKLGAKIYLDHQADQVPAEVEAVIYTIAVPKDNPELVRAKELNIPALTYPQALGLISADKQTIAVAGTHGKTTTTAMLGTIAQAAGLDPTVIVGSLMLGSDGQANQSNLVVGDSSWLIVEACEYQRSFLNLQPLILVITNIDEDHLDYYQDLADIQSAFADLTARVPADGVVICNTGDSRLVPVIQAAASQIMDYRQIDITRLKLPLPGRHNRLNAQAALAVAKFLALDDNLALATLSNFTGTWRRLEFRGRTKAGSLIYDDYAHHPTEIAASLEALKEQYPASRLIVIFQPHLYSRTIKLLNQFSASFKSAHQVVVAPIYAAREPDPGTVTNQDLAYAINQAGGSAEAVNNRSAIIARVGQLAGPKDIIVTMGAGDINNLVADLAV